MTRRPSLRKVAKWVGTVLSLFLVATYAASFWICVDCTPLAHCNVLIGNGNIGVAYSPVLIGEARGFRSWAPKSLEADDYPRVLLPELLFDPIACRVPQWIPLALIGVPTLTLWRSDRKAPPGRCRACGYDLTGNISRSCPECGKAVAEGGA